MLVRINVVGSEVERAGLFVNHPTRHRNRMLQDFVCDSNLFERVNSAGGESKIDRPAADHVAFTRITAAFIQINVVSTAAEIRGQQSAGEPATDQNKLRHSKKRRLTPFN